MQIYLLNLIYERTFIFLITDPILEYQNAVVCILQSIFGLFFIKSSKS